MQVSAFQNENKQNTRGKKKSPTLLKEHLLLDQVWTQCITSREYQPGSQQANLILSTKKIAGLQNKRNH